MKTSDKYSYFMKSSKTHINSMGLMSGTSLDGLDIALIRTNARDKFELNQFHTYKYSKLLKKSINDFIQNRKNIKKINSLITEFNIEAIKSFIFDFNIKKEDIDILGIHGQTIFHNPKEKWTWQLCDGKSIANAVNIPVISNFRYRDVCLGGEGAPLVGVWHKALLENIRDAVYPIVFLNIGGVSNITFLENKYDIPYSFDIGIGNGPIDTIVAEHFNIPFDKDGKIGLKGKANTDVINNILKNKWFKQKPPKSLDKHHFDYTLRFGLKDLSPMDKVATLSKLISFQLKESLSLFSLKPKRLYISGGGYKNQCILKNIKENYKNILTPLEDNWNPDAIEAQAFAYLASKSLKSMPYTWKRITGIKSKSSGGMLDFPD
ncbi:MAG: hypothetical protein CMJ12_02725 [Pelagibacterales bacterium]|mgnify:CR=1 FL=1|nr:hypothetical protein [Pelagibacterales bacterium]|tara:strand:+ start:18748 stop:19878 length:1131 start_codon:yes stop_codon:yes gene_type:complete